MYDWDNSEPSWYDNETGTHHSFNLMEHANYEDNYLKLAQKDLDKETYRPKVTATEKNPEKIYTTLYANMYMNNPKAPPLVGKVTINNYSYRVALWHDRRAKDSYNVVLTLDKTRITTKFKLTLNEELGSLKAVVQIGAKSYLFIGTKDIDAGFNKKLHLEISEYKYSPENTEPCSLDTELDF